MTDEAVAVQQPSDLKEIAAVHVFAAALVTIFFRWQASQKSFWQAGDESLIANGVGALIDMLYWLLKPRILKWRNG